MTRNGLSSEYDRRSRNPAKKYVAYHITPVLITIEPVTKTDDYTISNFLIGGKWFAYCIEDTDRGLTSDMSLTNIKSVKVYGKTAIPAGRYELVLTYSNRFRRELPEVLDVPGFTGIRIHSGNYNVHTEGCLLIGSTLIPHGVGNSRPTVDKFTKLLAASLRIDKAYIQINR